MGRRNKLQKFAELISLPNVYECYDPTHPQLEQNGSNIEMAGKWNISHFKNSNKLILELACGRGEYSLAMGKMYPNKNYIGVDVKGARLWKGAKSALNEDLTNVAFLRSRIEVVASFFEKKEVDEIWITFPDPFLSKDNRKLTSDPFINRYKKILKTNGVIHLKTDSEELYDFTLERIKSNNYELIYHNEDIYASTLLYAPELNIQTYYEKMHLARGKKIKYLQYKID